MPTILTEVMAIYRGTDDCPGLTNGLTYPLEIVFIREFRTVMTLHKHPEGPSFFCSYDSWGSFRREWEITEVLR